VKEKAVGNNYFEDFYRAWMKSLVDVFVEAKVVMK